MNTTSDAAEQVVRLMLNGVEVAAKITGSGAKELAVMVYAIMRDQKKTKGKTRLTNLLRSDKPLKVFAVKDDELEIFSREAKKYGILYCVLKDKDATDGLTDIMVKAEDASKINRIFERFKLSTVDVDQVNQEIEQQTVKDECAPAPETVPAEAQEDAFVDRLMSKPRNNQEQQTQTPTEGRVAKSRQSAPTSATRGGTARGDAESRPSVRQELKQIREDQAQTANRPPKNRSPRATQHDHNHHRRNGPKKQRSDNRCKTNSHGR